MAFKAKVKEIKPNPDCKDFKPYLFDKEHCKLTNKCTNAGGKYKIDSFSKYPNLCIGISQIKYDEWLKNKYK